jgi:hypothetical protein
VTLTIRPDNTSIEAGTVTVIVENPKALGSKYNTIDAAIYEVAHRWGAPPQYIKAHAHKESEPMSNRESYRYEPFGGDTSDLTAISREENLRVKLPNARFRLATEKDTLNDALLEGTHLTAADRDVRNVLRIGCNPDGTGGRFMRPEDSKISVWEIFRCSEKQLRMNWEEAAEEDGPASVKAIENDPFTAQTSLAASYGLLQVTHIVAIEKAWRTADGAQNPSLLFDTDSNLKRGGGSLSVGTLKVVNVVGTKLAGGKATPPTSADALLALFKNGWDRYNRGEEKYEDAVAGFVPLYTPVAAGPVLGGGL